MDTAKMIMLDLRTFEELSGVIDELLDYLADASGVATVHPMGAIGYFRTEKAATEFIVSMIAEARKWIDTRCGSPD